jgi:formate hydrogenlyase transcriptional activator
VLAVAKRAENAFDDDAVAFLTQIANQVAIGVENALAYSEIAELKDRLAQEKLYLEDELRGEMDFEGIIGQSSALRHVLNLVETVAPSDSTVLMLGETGTGKELIARVIHERSRRKERTFVKLNCAAIPTGLLESELFGHERGAFTGAISQKTGRLELADRGTLFLDEVGDIPIEIQPKLLRALQEREFERLGSTHTKKVDIRLVAATNRDLDKMIANREFRSDLYYRLNVFHINMPPLREHLDDLPAMAEAMVTEMNQKHGRNVAGVGQAILDRMMGYDWPGNARELRNNIERAVILCPDGSPLDAAHMPPTFGRSQVPVAQLYDASIVPIRVGTTVDEAERLLILRTLESTGQNKTRAAEILGVSLKTLHNKLKEYSQSREDQPA